MGSDTRQRVNDQSINFTQEKVATISELMKSSSSNSEFRLMISGLVKNVRKLTETQRQYTELEQLMHEIEVTRLMKKAQEEKIEILEEYLGLMEKHYKDQQQKT